MNNDFWVSTAVIANDFYEWKSLANCITSDRKISFTVMNVLFYFLNAILCPWTHNHAKNILSIADFAIVAKGGLFWLPIVTSLQLICDAMRMRGTGIVMSYLLIALAHANWHKGIIHWWITTMNIDFSPLSIHWSVGKKRWSWYCLIYIVGISGQ